MTSSNVSPTAGAVGPDPLGWPLPPAHFHQAADDVAHHVFEKCRPFHLEFNLIPGAPRNGQLAQLAQTVSRLAVRGSKCREIVASQQRTRPSRDRRQIERLENLPMGTPTKGGSGAAIADQVAIALPLALPPRIELLEDFGCAHHGDILRQQLAQPHPVRLQRQDAAGGEAGDLPRRVDSRIRPRRGCDGHALAQQPIEGILHRLMNRLAVLLNLPPHVIRAVVFQNQFDSGHDSRLRRKPGAGPDRPDSFRRLTRQMEVVISQ